MRATRCYRVAFADAELNLLLWVLQEETKTARQDIKGIAYVAMAVPRHGLSWRQLQFANSKARALQVVGSTLDLVEMAGVFKGYLLASAP